MGSKGHAMVAKVAFSYLEESTKKNVLAHLDGMTIEDAANWMDDIKDDRSKDFMKPYHYANFQKGFKVVDKERSNILHILNNTILELEKNTNSQKKK